LELEKESFKFFGGKNRKKGVLIFGGKKSKKKGFLIFFFGGKKFENLDILAGKNRKIGFFGGKIRKKKLSPGASFK
jgi:hypothetical protein